MILFIVDIFDQTSARLVSSDWKLIYIQWEPATWMKGVRFVQCPNFKIKPCCLWTN